MVWSTFLKFFFFSQLKKAQRNTTILLYQTGDEFLDIKEHFFWEERLTSEDTRMNSYIFLCTCQFNRCWDMVQNCSFHLWKMWKKSTWNSLHMHCVLSQDKRKRVTCLFCRVVFIRKENKSIAYQVLQTEQYIVDHFSRPDVKLTVLQTDQFSAFSVLIYNFSLTPNLRTDIWTLLLTNVESVTFLSVVFILFLSSQMSCLNINNIES